MNGYGDFKYGVDFTWNWQGARFDEVRLWCWETFGPSVELDIWAELETIGQPRNLKWCWDRGTYNKINRCMIYIKDDQEMNWFKLRWGTE